MDAVLEGAGAGAAGAGAGAGPGSGVLQALPPQGSILADMALTAAVGLGDAAGLSCNEGPERLNAELISCWGEVTVDFGGDTGGEGEEERPKRSLERDEEGG